MAALVSIFDDKSQLRKEMIRSVRALTPARREEKSRQILERLIGHPALLGAGVCGFYASLPSEPDLSGLLGHAALAGVRFCVPRVSGSGMTFHRIGSMDDLGRSEMGLREPLKGAPRILPQEIDLLIIPALAYSEKTGHRLGRGGGYYDRFLRIPQTAKRIGVCFDEQIVPRVPVEKHDKQVEEIVSDLRCVTP